MTPILMQMVTSLKENTKMVNNMERMYTFANSDKYKDEYRNGEEVSSKFLVRGPFFQ